MDARTIRTEAATYTAYVNTVDPSLPYNVFLHGGPGFNCYPDRQVMGPRLHETTNLVWFDQIGCAEAPANSPEFLTWDRQIDDIIDVIRAIAGTNAVNLVGMCVGSLITHSIVERDRSMVNKVLWYSPATSLTAVLHRLLSRSIAEGRLSETSLSSEERTALERFNASPHSDASVDDVAVLLQLLPKIRDFHDLYWQDKDKMAAYLRFMEERPPAFDVLVAITLSYIGKGVPEVPSYDGIPVLSLYSNEDGITPWADHGQNLMTKIPHMRTKCIPNGFHWLQFENTDEVCAVTAKYLGSETVFPP